MSGRPGEVSPRWAARKLGQHVKTIRRWCAEGRLTYVRTELGVPVGGAERHVKRYWLSRIEVEALAAEAQQPAA